MGNKCTWKDNKEEVAEVKFNAMTEEKKSKGKVILSFLYINLFRKKLHDLQNDISNNISISKYFRTAVATSDINKENSLQKAFQALVTDCNENIQKCKLQEFNIVIEIDRIIDRTITELVNYYTFEINKNLEALQKLIFANEKVKNDEDLTKLISNEVSKVFDY
jgi:hypothetical protein